MFMFCSGMSVAPYDRSLALAAQIRTMRDHFLEIRCGCGARRVVALARMAENPRMATATLAHVALRAACHRCHTGPTAVHLCATVNGLEAPPFGGGILWSIPLVERPDARSYHLRTPAP